MRDVTTLVAEAAAVESSAQRRSDAFGELVVQFQDMAVGYAYARLGNFQLAEHAASPSRGAASRRSRSKRVRTTSLAHARRIPSGRRAAV